MKTKLIKKHQFGKTLQTINNWQNSYSEPRYTYYRRWLNADNISDKQITEWSHAWAKNAYGEKYYNTLCKTNKGRQIIKNSYLEAMCDNEFGKRKYPPIAKTPAQTAASIAASSIIISPYFPMFGTVGAVLDGTSDIVSFIAKPSKDNLKSLGWDSFGPTVDKVTDFIPGNLDDAIADPISKTATQIAQMDDIENAASSSERQPWEYSKHLQSPINQVQGLIHKIMSK